MYLSVFDKLVFFLSAVYKELRLHRTVRNNGERTNEVHSTASFHAAAVIEADMQISGGTIGRRVWSGDRSPSRGHLCFFWRALQFWNQTCVTRLLSPVMLAILSKSCPSGFESIEKLAWRICNCSSVKVVLIRFDLFLLNPSQSYPSVWK